MPAWGGGRLVFDEIALFAMAQRTEQQSGPISLRSDYFPNPDTPPQK
jgi:hypothetical protein